MRFLFYLILLFSIFCQVLAQESTRPEIKKREPLSGASRQWLEEVVPYIITPKEREFFINLPNEEERRKFIELFWRKRDPNPQTPENEFKIEYFKRIAAANKLFGTGGIAGWRTDRGKIYILLGPPKEIQRDMKLQSPATTLVSVFQGPKETWQYWGPPNPKLPYNMEFVFVDKFSTGNYALENSFRADTGQNQPFDPASITYQFDYLEFMAEAQKNPFEGFDKLKDIITTQVSYNLIPFKYNYFSFKGSETKTYIPLVLEIPLSSLSPQKIGLKNHYSLSLILDVSNSLGQVTLEKSKDFDFQEEGDKIVRILSPLYLEPADYSLHLLILDNVTGKVGTIHQRISVPKYNTEELALSDIILSRTAAGEEITIPTETKNALITETLMTQATREFRTAEELNVYMEVYNLFLNPETGLNKFKVEYSFLSQEKLLTSVPSEETSPTSQKDCRVQTSFRLKNFRPGPYALRIKINDEISRKSLTRDVPFAILE